MLSTLLSLILALVTAPAQAGSVQTNVRVCGVTAPYDRFGEQAPGLFGNSSTGLVDQFFRLRGYLNLDPVDSGDSKADVVADFIAAASFKGVRMCVRGNLETAERNGKALFYLSVKGFQVLEKTEDFLNPSQLAGVYSLPLPSAPALALVPADDENFGRRYFFTSLAQILKPMLGAPCPGLDAALDTPAMISFVLTRKSLTQLGADAVQLCNGEADRLRLHVELNPTGGTITAERPSTGKAITLEIHR